MPLTQPTSPAVDSGSPRAANLVAWLHPDAGNSRLTELVSAKHLTLSGATITTNEDGDTVGRFTAAGAYADGPTSAAVQAITELTRVWVGRFRGQAVTDSGQPAYLSGVTYDNALGSPYFLAGTKRQPGSPERMGYDFSAGGGFQGQGNSDDVSGYESERIVVILRVKNGQQDLWIGPAGDHTLLTQIKTSSVAGAPGASATARQFVGMYPGTGAATVSNFDIAGSGLYNAFLGASDLNALADDPWVDVRSAPDTTPPADPTSFTVMQTRGDGVAHLSWTNPPDSDFAAVEASWSRDGGSTWRVEKETSSNSTTITNLWATTTPTNVLFRIRARDNSNNWSGYVQASYAMYVQAGWKPRVPSADSLVFYVKPSTGNDTNDGLTEGAPLATISHANSLCRDGYPDFICLRRGETFTNQPINFGSKSGRSHTEKRRVLAYGTGARPKIAFTHDLGSSAVVGTAKFFGVHDCDIYCSDYDGANGTQNVYEPNANDADFTFENCQWHDMFNGPQLNALDIGEVFRCASRDMYVNGRTLHATCLYAGTWQTSLTIDQCFFDRGGFKYGVVQRSGIAQGGTSSTITLDAGASSNDGFYNGARITITSGTGAGQTRQIRDVDFNYDGTTKVAPVYPNWTTPPDNTSHFQIIDAQASALARNLYISTNAPGAGGSGLGATISNTISMRSSSEAIQLRSGGTISACFVADSSGVFIAGSGEIVDCVVEGSSDIAPDPASRVNVDTPRGAGFMAIACNGVTIRRCIAHKRYDPATAGVTAFMAVDSTEGGHATNVLFEECIAHNWQADPLGTTCHAFYIGVNSQNITVHNCDLQMPGGGVAFHDDSGDGTVLTASRLLGQYMPFGGSAPDAAQAVTYSDPSRDLKTYMRDVLGMDVSGLATRTAVCDAFSDACWNAQDYGAWDDRYTAEALDNYIRTGFDKALVGHGWELSVGVHRHPAVLVRARGIAPRWPGG